MKTVEFGELFQFMRNGMSIKQDKSGDGLPISRIETIADSSIDPARVGYAGLSFDACKDWLLQEGDILFSHINSVEHLGKCAVYRGVPAQLVHGMNLLCFRPDPAQVTPEFAKYLIRSTSFRDRLSNFVNKAVNQASVSIGNLRTIPVRIPPLEEQRRIAAILDQAETLRTHRRTALALLDSLTQSLFLDLLEYAGSDVKKVAVEDAMDAIIDYRGKTPEKTTQGVPLVTAKVVKNGVLLEPDEFIAEDAYDDWMQRGFPEAGDVLFTTEAPLGEVAQLDGRKVALAQRLLVLRGKHGLLQNTFLRFALTSWEVRRQIETRATGSTVKGIRQKELRQVELPIPPFALQQTFATRIASIEALKATHRRALAALDALFASLQQRAFAGQL